MWKVFTLVLRCWVLLKGRERSEEDVALGQVLQGAQLPAFQLLLLAHRAWFFIPIYDTSGSATLVLHDVALLARSFLLRDSILLLPEGVPLLCTDLLQEANDMRPSIERTQPSADNHLTFFFCSRSFLKAAFCLSASFASRFLSKSSESQYALTGSQAPPILEEAPRRRPPCARRTNAIQQMASPTLHLSIPGEFEL